MVLLYSFLMILAAYFLGSISTAIIVCSLCKLPDPRSQGSQNPGATNVMRIGGRLPAAITLIGDSLKGFVPVFIVKLLELPDCILGLTILSAFIGHLFPIFFSFKGGKGVATYLGGVFGLSWLVGTGMLLAWLTMFFLIRISAVAAIFMVIAAPILAWSVFKNLDWNIFILTVVSFLTIFTHRNNLSQLIKKQK